MPLPILRSSPTTRATLPANFTSTPLNVAASDPGRSPACDGQQAARHADDARMIGRSEENLNPGRPHLRIRHYSEALRRLACLGKATASEIEQTGTQIQERDLVPALGQPDGVASRSTTSVEDPTGWIGRRQMAQQDRTGDQILQAILSPGLQPRPLPLGVLIVGPPNPVKLLVHRPTLSQV